MYGVGLWKTEKSVLTTAAIFFEFLVSRKRPVDVSENDRLAVAFLQKKGQKFAKKV